MTQKFNRQICIYITIFVFCISSYAEKQPILVLQNPDPIHPMEFSPDGSKLMTGFRKSYIWNLKTGEHILTIESTAAASVAFSPDGKMVATGTNPLTMAVWNASTGEKIQTFKGVDDPYSGPETITAIAFHPTKNSVVTSTEHGIISVWDISSGKETSITDSGLSATHIYIFSDGDRIAVGNKIISLEKKSILYEFPARITVVNKEQYIQTIERYANNLSRSIKNVVFYNPQNYRQIQKSSPLDAEILNAYFPPNGMLLLVKQGLDGEHGKIELLDIQKNQSVFTFDVADNEEDVYKNIRFSPDGKHMAAVNDQTIYIWDISDLYSNVEGSEALNR